MLPKIVLKRLLRGMSIELNEKIQVENLVQHGENPPRYYIWGCVIGWGRLECIGGIMNPPKFCF